jgi:hypothetical protein
MAPKRKLYGLLAEFADPAALVKAGEEAHEHGYRVMDGYSPFHVEGLAHAIGFHRTKLPYVVLFAGMLGAAAGFLLQYYAAAVDYPVNVGGRPPLSWPAFIPITFECTVLFAALGAVLGMLMMNGLPMPYHPVFNVPRFEVASSTGFFLCIEAQDPMFDPVETRQFLENLQAVGVYDVEP